MSLISGMGGVSKVFRLSFYSIVLIKRGEFCIDINFEKYKIASNDVLIMRPGDVMSCDADENVDFLELSFQEGIIRKMFPDGTIFQHVDVVFDKSAPHVYTVEACQFLDMWRNIKSMDMVLGMDDYPLRRCVLIARIVDVFCTMYDLCGRVSDGQTDMRKPEAGESFQNLVDKHYADWSRVADYARYLCMSESSLLKQVKMKYGKTPKQMIQERRIFEAKQLLLYSNDDAESIAVKIGYRDSRGFLRAFCDYTGIGVDDFRKTRK